MRRVLLPLFWAAALSCAALPLLAQVTITSDFPRGTDFVDTIYRTGPNMPFPAPQMGADQFWDYSQVWNSLEGAIAVSYFDAAGNTVFPGAHNRRERNLSFQGLLIESEEYEGLDEQGWYDMGRTIEDVTYPITATTGGANDVLRFVGGTFPYGGRLDYVKFPLNYEDEWTDTTTNDLEFRLSVAAFGLNAVPGNRVQTITQQRRVSGYGRIVVPKSDGTPSLPIDVLLVSVNSTIVDSIFLGGQPAPPPLMAAFGLTQGDAFSSTFYLFYSPDFGVPILDLGNRVFFRPSVADVLTSIAEPSLPATRAFPCPVAPGQALNIEIEAPMAAGTLRLIDITGRTLAQQAFDASSGRTLQLDIPAHLRAGMYVYQLFGPNGQLAGAGKLQVTAP